MPQAISFYKDVKTLTDDEGLLNLAWTLDERGFLSVDLDPVISLELEGEIRGGLEYINRYLVKDPYGEDLLGSAIATFFSRTGWSCCVTCGAGVISLLHSLARLSDGKPAHVIGDIYPDFPFWVEQSKGKCISHSSNLSVDDLVKDLNAVNASLVFLERPGLMNDRFSDLLELAALCDGVALRNALVVVDESNANYCPQAYSAANIVDKVENLIVVRGFSKAYGLGGLRLSYCLASKTLKEGLRSVIPPLLASSLSLRIGRKILELGDIASPLRARIRESKEEMIELFRLSQFNEILVSSEYMPYILIKNGPDYIRSRLESNGILGKFHPIWSESKTKVNHVYRLSAPLSSRRMELLRQKITTAMQGRSGLLH